MTYRQFLQAHPDLRVADGLFYETVFAGNSEFTTSYLELRKKEGRLYTDEAVRSLPQISSSHPTAQEWAIRKRSADRLIKRLQTRKITSIVELGCGNGWLVNYLSKSLHYDFCGIDINIVELQHAARLFGSDERVNFIRADIFSKSLDTLRADIFILAGAVQYFSNLKPLLERLLSQLNPNGEIHILDSPFYKESEVKEARERSHRYLAEQGQPMMQNYYFYHGWDSIRSFQYEVLYDPSRLFNRLRRQVVTDSPFPWIKFSKGPALTPRPE